MAVSEGTKDYRNLTGDRVTEDDIAYSISRLRWGTEVEWDLIEDDEGRIRQMLALGLQCAEEVRRLQAENERLSAALSDFHAGAAYDELEAKRLRNLKGVIDETPSKAAVQDVSNPGLHSSEDGL